MANDERYRVLDAKAGEWFEGVLLDNAMVVVPRRDPETGLAEIGRQDLCNLVGDFLEAAK